jgi:cytidylate kinase
MTDVAALDHCRTFIDSQLEPAKAWQRLHSFPSRPAITVSRQAGCGALVVAKKLAALFQQEASPDDAPWTVFDRELMEKVLEDHNLPARLAKFLPEDRATELQDITDEFFGLRPASWTIIQQTSETILKLAELGNVILIGRGANVVTAKLPHVLHVRLVAPLEARIEHCRTSYNMTARAAREFCQHEDEGRRRYLKKYFQADVENTLLYDLTINTGNISFDAAAGLIADAVKAKVSALNPSRTNSVR